MAARRQLHLHIHDGVGGWRKRKRIRGGQRPMRRRRTTRAREMIHGKNAEVRLTREGYKVSGCSLVALAATLRVRIRQTARNGARWNVLVLEARMNIHLMLSTSPALESSSFSSVRLIHSLPAPVITAGLVCRCFRRLRR